MLKTNLVLLACISLLCTSSGYAQNPDAVEIPGDVHITGPGNCVVFADNSTQCTATLQGPPGQNGPANTLSIGTVTTGAPGSNAAASITGSSPSQTLNLTIPQGLQGPIGAAGLTFPHVQANGTNFVVPANVTKIAVELWGAGGSGAGGASGGGGGGGGGEYAYNVFDVNPGDVYPITVGSASTPNMNFRMSSFGSLITVYGGENGNTIHGGIGESSSSGGFRMTGQAGQDGYAYTISTFGGNGGAAFRSSIGGVGGAISSIGTNGYGYGAGGGGGGYTTMTGGKGTDGAVIVYY